MEVKDLLKTRRMQMGLTLKDVARLVGVSPPTVSRWERGEISNMKRDKIAKLATTLELSPEDITGTNKKKMNLPKNATIIKMEGSFSNSVPILGRISCGSGAFLDESFDGKFEIDSSVEADYCLIARGDSMIEAGIDDGDRVFLRKTSALRDGHIYATVIKGEDTAVLKKLYRDKNQIVLQPCNSNYRPQILPKSDVLIVGECTHVLKTVK